MDLSSVYLVINVQDCKCPLTLWLNIDIAYDEVF